MSDRKRPDVRAIQAGEILALYSRARHLGPKGFFWLWAPPAKRNERYGDVSVVNVRGPLEHHEDAWGDSYESVVKRVENALTGCDVVAEWERKNYWKEDAGAPPVATPPKCVVLRIDSPGGVVAGLNESVRKLRRCALDAGIPLKAYVDEMAASAAYAIACACDEIVCPRSAILGSVGVISTMVDQTAADEEAGLRFVTITSGNRKADGHPHVPIEDDAVAAERSRVMTLAGEFFQLVSESRELSVDQIRGFQAGIFLGRAARKAGLADAVMGWDAYLEKLGLDNGKPSKSPSPVSPTRQPALGDAKMNKQIDRLKAQIAKEKDPAKLAALATQLAGYKKTEKHVEHVKTEEEDDEEESEESEEAKGNETDRSDEPEDDEEKDDEEEDDEESEESEKKSTKKSSKKSEEQEEAKAMRAVYKAACQATGKSGKRVAGALAALLAEAREMPALRSRVARIEKNERKAKREGMVESAKAQRRITPHEAKVLASKSLEFVTDYLAMRPNAIVSGHDDELLVPSGKEHADLPSSAMQEIDRAVAAQYPDGAAPEKRELFKAKLVENARKAIAEMNGAAVGRH